MPSILKLAQLIDRYGVKAVTGRDYLGAGEILQIQTAEAVVRLYHEMKSHQSWADWAAGNTRGAQFLMRATELANEAGLIDGS